MLSIGKAYTIFQYILIEFVRLILPLSVYSHVDDSEDLLPGWSVLSRKQDVSDLEWSTWKLFLWTLAPWLCIHLVVAEFLRIFRYSV